MKETKGQREYKPCGTKESRSDILVQTKNLYGFASQVVALRLQARAVANLPAAESNMFLSYSFCLERSRNIYTKFRNIFET